MTIRKPVFEFFGPYIGPTGIVFGLPIVCYILAFLVSSTDPVELGVLWENAEFVSLFDVVIVFGYVGVVIALHRLLPARHVQGTPLESKHRLKYRLNGQCLHL